MVSFLQYIRHTGIIFKFFIYVCLTLFYCEYLHYYATIITCKWPDVDDGDSLESPVRAMVVADTHLLGSRNGHWFDKLRREWQMHRAFQTAIFLHQPEVVIFLGDLFDEGKWCSSEEFAGYVRRFAELFRVGSDTKVIVVPGNHDMGFHYSLTPSLVGRFETAFNAPSVSVSAVRGVVFVGVNSMAMHGDGCSFCTHAQTKLHQLTKELMCQRTAGPCPAPLLMPPTTSYSRPVLLQHFPLYRPSDASCSGPDAAPPEERTAPFRGGWECMSPQASLQLLSSLEPRLVLSGHTHHGCTTLHTHPPVHQPQDGIPEAPTDDSDPDYADYYERQRHAAAHQGGQRDTDQPTLQIEEINVPSFSWRNKKEPTFAMVSVNTSHHSVYRCAMPREQTVMLLYCLATGLLVLSLARRKLWWLAPLCYHLTLRCGRTKNSGVKYKTDIVKVTKTMGQSYIDAAPIVR